MTQFRKALDQLRQKDGPGTFSISDQLSFLKDRTHGEEFIRSRPAHPQNLPEGRVEENVHGSHYVIREDFDGDHYHGNIRMGRLCDEDLATLLDLARCKHDGLERDRIIFLDTETTGIQGGAGMCPFLIGVGFFRGDDFHVVQYFIRDFDEEPSMLLALGQMLKEFDLIVTYNGKTFDLPLVDNRFILSRMEKPFGHMSHFDLLFTARRLWRNGHGSCRLTALEHKLLQFIRGPDIHGSMIPRAYFDYLNHFDATPLRSVFSHNVYDILSLAGLTIHACDRVVTEPAPLDDALDVYSLGKIFDRVRNRPKSIECYELALRSALPTPLRVRALERLSILYRRVGEHGRSLETCKRLMNHPAFSLIGYEGAAIHYSRHAHDTVSALRVVAEALGRTEGIAPLARRRARLEVRMRRLESKRELDGEVVSDPWPGVRVLRPVIE